MRRAVVAVGGYYSRQRGKWVLPGAQHNLTPWAVEPQFFSSLEDAAEAVDEHASARRAVYDFAEVEATLGRVTS